jgi:vancomycin permeability regulator SanA
VRPITCGNVSRVTSPRQRVAPVKPRRWLRRTLVTLLVVALVVGLGPAVMVRLVSASRITTVEQVAPHDVAIVFGAGLGPTGQPGNYLTARLEVAKALFEAGQVRVILVSGGNPTASHDEPTAMKAWLGARGIPEDKVVADFAGWDTYSTCLRARQVFGVTAAVLVSQAYHLPRAVTTCRLVGLDAVGVADRTIAARWTYQVRELLADVNMVVEVLTRRQTTLGPREWGVDEALGR